MTTVSEVAHEPVPVFASRLNSYCGEATSNLIKEETMAVMSVGGKRFAVSTLLKWWVKETLKGVIVGTLWFLTIATLARTVGIWFPKVQLPLMALLGLSFLIGDAFDGYDALFVSLTAAITTSKTGRRVIMLLFALFFIAVFATFTYMVCVRWYTGQWINDFLVAIPSSAAAALVLAPIAKALNPREMFMLTGPHCTSCGVQMEHIGVGVEMSHSTTAYGGGRYFRTASKPHVAAARCPNCGHTRRWA